MDALRKLLAALLLITGSISVIAQEDKVYTSLEEALANKDKVYKLDLSNNQLTSLPKSIGNLKNLQKLFLGNNQLASLPESIGNLTNLQMLALNNNNLKEAEKERIKQLLPIVKLNLKDKFNVCQ